MSLVLDSNPQFVHLSKVQEDEIYGVFNCARVILTDGLKKNLRNIIDLSLYYISFLFENLQICNNIKGAARDCAALNIAGAVKDRHFNYASCNSFWYQRVTCLFTRRTAHRAPTEFFLSFWKINKNIWKGTNIKNKLSVGQPEKFLKMYKCFVFNWWELNGRDLLLNTCLKPCRVVLVRTSPSGLYQRPQLWRLRAHGHSLLYFISKLNIDERFLTSLLLYHQARYSVCIVGGSSWGTVLAVDVELHGTSPPGPSWCLYESAGLSWCKQSLQWWAGICTKRMF